MINSNRNLLESTQQAMQSTSIIYERINVESCLSNRTGEITVSEDTSFNAAKPYSKAGSKVAVLNFASAVNPCGGVTIGAMAQEECLCRSSSLTPCLKQQYLMKEYYMPHRISQNPMYSDKLIYTKGVMVFKDDNEVPQLMAESEWFNVDVITCAAPNISHMENVNENELSSVFQSRIRSILNAAIKNDADVIILGAFGCGAFKNPPQLVADAFKKVLVEEDYKSYFEKVVFAIKKSKNDNFNVFRNVFAECNESEHEFVKHEEITGATEYVCRKCGVSTSVLSLPEPDCYFNLKEFIGSTLDGKEITADWFEKTVNTNEGILKKLCSYCNSEINAEDKFCMMCGKQVAFDSDSVCIEDNDNTIESNTKTCSNCGAKVRINDNFCLMCGKKINEDNDITEDENDEDDIKQENEFLEFIDDRYKLIRQVGKGASSIVYLAQDIKLERICAVKIIKKDTYANTLAAQESLDEANKLKLLAHISIPQLYDIYDDDEKLCIVMEFIEGKNLSEIIKSIENPLDEYTVVSWSKQLCRVLFYLHTLKPPRIFRDLKPANIILQPNGVIKLIDFGTMKIYDESRAEDTVNLGTKGYAAPEQFGGRGQTDARTDIYGLGMTMFHLITGVNPALPPFEFKPISFYRKDISKGLEKIIMKCIEVDREERYQSAMALLYDLEKLN